MCVRACLSGTREPPAHEHAFKKNKTKKNNGKLMPACGHLPRRQSTKRAHSYSVFGSPPADVVKSHRQWAVAVQQIVRHHEGEGGGNAKVRHEADEQRGHDADRDGSLGILHLLT